MKKLMMAALCALGVNVARAEDTRDYLSFTATDGDVTIGMKWAASAKPPTTNHIFEWSADKANWTEFLTGSSNMTVHAGETVYFRRKGDEKVTTLNPNSEYFGWQFTMAPESEGATIAAGGNVMSLLDASCEQVEVGGSAFLDLFYNCKALTAAPELPATTLAERCYYKMFSGCAALTAAPELPATTLAEYCYYEMFSGCTALTAAPELPAEALAEGCYQYMFEGCTALTAAPELPATALAELCYGSMFSGCAALTAAPELPATTLAESCYYEMFSGCAALCWIKVGFTAWDNSAFSATANWVKGVAASGLFVCPSALNDQRDSSHIPSGWTKTDAASVRVVIVPKVEHLKTAVTMNGSAVTALEYVVGSTRWMVAKGAAVQVEFSADEEGYGVKGTTSYSIDSLTDDVVFGTTPGYPLPKVEVPVGKWTVGEDARAYLYASGDLEITGTGAMYDFASAEDVPWAAFVGDVTAVTIAQGVSLGKNALAVLSDNVLVTSSSSVGALKGALGTPTEPSGAVSGAEPERIKIVDGKVLLGVSVCTNSEVKVIGEGEDCGWQKAAIEKAEVVDGEAILTVPATAEQGFMLLKSKGAAPSNIVIEDR